MDAAVADFASALLALFFNNTRTAGLACLRVLAGPPSLILLDFDHRLTKLDLFDFALIGHALIEAILLKVVFFLFKSQLSDHFQCQRHIELVVLMHLGKDDSDISNLRKARKQWDEIEKLSVCGIVVPR